MSTPPPPSQYQVRLDTVHVVYKTIYIGMVMANLDICRCAPRMRANQPEIADCHLPSLISTVYSFILLLMTYFTLQHLTLYCHFSSPSSTYAGPSRAPLSTTTQLEDSGDIFESRASSAITMCPSPHTPGPAGKETPLVRTHPFSFRSPVPTTPEPRSHGR